MFTGIVQTIGRVRSVQPRPTGLRVTVRPERRMTRVRLGESIAVDGVCLTVTSAAAGTLVFDVVPETLRLTTLKNLKAGSRVNLERALRYGDRVGGHLVEGHVRGTVRLLAVERARGEVEFQMELPKKFSKKTKLKGFVTLDGISLTVSRRTPQSFSVHIVPHTLRHTTLAFKKSGDSLNFEPA